MVYLVVNITALALVFIISFYLYQGSCEDINLNEVTKFKRELLVKHQALKNNYKNLNNENQKLKQKNNIFQNELIQSQIKIENINDQLKTLRNKTNISETCLGVTKIGEDLDIDITHCNTSNCFTHDIHYNSQKMEQIKALIETSSECYQEMIFHCHSTPLIAPVRFY